MADKSELFMESQAILTTLGGDEVEGHRILDVVKEIREIVASGDFSGSGSGGSSGGSSSGDSCDCEPATEAEITSLFG